MNTPRRSTTGRMWCGPAALSAVTGKTVEELGLQEVRSMHDAQLQNKLYESGFTSSKVKIRYATFDRTRRDPWWPGFVHNETVVNTPTLARFLRERTPEQRRQTMVIAAGSHYVVVERDWLVDNSNPDGVDIMDYGFRRRRVTAAFIVTRRTK